MIHTVYAWWAAVHCRNRRRVHLSALLILVCGVALTLAGCGAFGAEAATPEPTRTPVPTFTPTPEIVPATSPAVETPPAATTPVADALAVTAAAPTATPGATETPVAARLTIAGEAVNVRSGPATTYDLVATAAAGGRFAITGRNAAGDWWQICCVSDQPGWVFGELATVENIQDVALVEGSSPAPEVATADPLAAATEAVVAAPATAAPVAVATADPFASGAGDFNPDAQYQIVHFKVRGLDENNGGIRDSSAQHLIFITVLDQNGNTVDGAVVRNLVGEKGDVVSGSKGPGMAEITMYWEPFKLTVASDPGGPVTSQTSNQMGLAFPHLPDLVGKLGDVNYEYGACPTIDIKCAWPITAIHYSYEITFQKV
jgi:SH3-like domain-containing protein